MSLFVDPRMQVVDSNGKPIEGAKLYFFAIGTSTLKTIYSDSSNTTPQANPATSDADGRFPAIFIDGLYKVVLKNNGTTIFTQDPAGDVTTGAFSLWSNDATYNIPDIVLGSDDNYYKSIINLNQGNDPISTPLAWELLIMINNLAQTITGNKNFADGISLAGTAVTSTAPEINQLHLSGVTQADLIKLHAVTSSATQLDYAPVGTFYTDSGTANSYILNPISTWTTPPSYFNGFVFSFRVVNTNTGPSTANPGALGAKNIYINGSALVGGELVAGEIVVLRYNLSGDRFDIELSSANFVGKYGNQSMAGSLAVAGTLRSMPTMNHMDIGAISSVREPVSGVLTTLVNNLRHDGTNERYIANGFAELLQLSTSDGALRYYTAPSGTAGNIATLTQRFSVLTDGTAFLNLNQIWDAGNLAAGTRGAHVYTSSFSLNTGAGTIVTFDNEAYDTDGIHDNVTNNTRLTVPSGVSKVMIVANFRFPAVSTGSRIIYILKNGADIATRHPSQASPGMAAIICALNASSGVLDVSPGDYFELYAFQDSGGLMINMTAWFAMVIIK